MIWKMEGFYEVSLHRKNSLLNRKEKQTTKVRHFRCFISLYKTLHMYTTAIPRILAPLENVLASKLSQQPITWYHSLSRRFREAKAHINLAHTLYLPHKDNEFLIMTNTTQTLLFVCHTIYAIKPQGLVPVRFHSSKFKPACSM